MVHSCPLGVNLFAIDPYRPYWEQDKITVIIPHEIAVDAGMSWFEQYYDKTILIYPIIAPRDTTHNQSDDTTHYTPDDTTHRTPDSLGIGSVQHMARYVNLLPNPANDKVQVTSSFGMRHVDVYNSAGVKVMEQSASGLSTILDIETLPDGTYLVRVTTPQGIITKKLIVQRK